MHTACQTIKKTIPLPWQGKIDTISIENFVFSPAKRLFSLGLQLRLYQERFGLKPLTAGWPSRPETACLNLRARVILIDFGKVSQLLQHEAGSRKVVDGQKSF